MALQAIVLPSIKRPWGYEIPMIVMDDNTGMQRNCQPYFKTEPTEEEIAAEIEIQKGFLQNQISAPEVDVVQEEIQQAVDKMAELSFKYPERVSAVLKAAVDMATTEGLLSADGKPVTIDAPEGWK